MASLSSVTVERLDLALLHKDIGQLLEQVGNDEPEQWEKQGRHKAHRQHIQAQSVQELEDPAFWYGRWSRVGVGPYFEALISNGRDRQPVVLLDENHVHQPDQPKEYQAKAVDGAQNPMAASQHGPHNIDHGPSLEQGQHADRCRA